MSPEIEANQTNNRVSKGSEHCERTALGKQSMIGAYGITQLILKHKSKMYAVSCSISMYHTPKHTQRNQTPKQQKTINESIKQSINESNKQTKTEPTNQPTQPNPTQTKPTNVKVANRNNKRATTRRVTSKIYLDLLFSLRA